MSKYKGFTQVELTRPKRSMFDMSHEKRLSTRIGRLTPCFISEALPNDTFQVSTEVLIKLAPLIAPIFHRLNLYVHYFFVPNRLLWEDWEDFITGGRLGGAVTTPPVPPNFHITRILNKLQEYLNTGSTADYLGVQNIPDTDVLAYDSDQSLHALPFAAWYKIYVDYYRDRNYVVDQPDALPMPSGSVPDVSDYYGLFFTEYYRGWQHEYFTSALPWTQRGAEVLMPLEGSGSVTYLDQSKALRSTTGFADTAGELESLALGPVDAPNLTINGGSGLEAARIENIDEVQLDSSSVSINDLRRAVALQKWLERNALAGSRYNESIMAHFGRKTSDSRLQRAEYLGGGKAVIQISEVMTTAYSEDSEASIVPPGNPTGRGSSYSTTNRFRYNCEEHGFVIGVLSVMPTSGYSTGVNRMFTSRRTFLEYPWPTFAHLGEQPVYDHELFVSPNTLVNDGDSGDYPVFGYQSRYADWKSIHSSTHGDFRTTLNYWHLDKAYGSIPVLGADFVTFPDSLQDRIFNVSEVDTLWLYIYNQCKVVRSLPYFGTPRL